MLGFGKSHSVLDSWEAESETALALRLMNSFGKAEALGPALRLMFRLPSMLAYGILVCSARILHSENVKQRIIGLTEG